MLDIYLICASIELSPVMSSLIKTRPVFEGAGLNVSLTFSPVCNPTPSRYDSFEIVFWGTVLLIISLYYQFSLLFHVDS